MTLQQLLAITFLMAAGCAATFEQLQARAAIDLDCRPEAITAQAVDAETRIASGCGKQAVYIESCMRGNHSDCTWSLNSPVRTTGAAP
jgi:hypothetical protein